LFTKSHHYTLYPFFISFHFEQFKNNPPQGFSFIVLRVVGQIRTEEKIKNAEGRIMNYCGWQSTLYSQNQKLKRVKRQEFKIMDFPLQHSSFIHHHTAWGLSYSDNPQFFCEGRDVVLFLPAEGEAGLEE